MLAYNVVIVTTLLFPYDSLHCQGLQCCLPCPAQRRSIGESWSFLVSLFLDIERCSACHLLLSSIWRMWGFQPCAAEFFLTWEEWKNLCYFFFSFHFPSECCADGKPREYSVRHHICTCKLCQWWWKAASAISCNVLLEYFFYKLCIDLWCWLAVPYAVLSHCLLQ